MIRYIKNGYNVHGLPREGGDPSLMWYGSSTRHGSPSSLGRQCARGRQIIILFFNLLLLINIGHAESRTMTQTKSQLKQIENKMTQLQLNINRTHDKQSVINQELANTNKQLHDASEQLKKTQFAMINKQRQITALAQQVKILSEQLHTQQALLAKHIRVHYKMGEYQPVKWLLNQDKPDSIDRLFIFNQYLVHSRQRSMDNVNKIRTLLILNQNKLHQELVAQERLKQQLNKRQQAFDNDRRYRTALIGSMTRDIQNQQQTLLVYKRNKANLSRLLTTLAQKSVIQTRRPFTRMRKKLQTPVITNSGGIKKINQGVVFFSNEGSPVASIFPGKVVFGDWLNGYGLLLIVDHGRGLMTLYANNKSLLTHKGDVVNQGEKIALVGHSGTLKENGLYFEIRQRGKAVNPLEWMS